MNGSRLSLLAVLLVFAALILSIPAGRRPFWSQDEARFALLAQDILEHGRWFMPELRGQPYLNKPQLYFWSIALASLPAGRVTELTAALPSVASALAGVAGVVAIGRLLWGWQAGLVAGLILPTTPIYFVIGHQVLPDVMLTAWMIWALYFLLRAARAGWSRAFLLAFYACVGGAMLSKGPAGLAALLAGGVAAVGSGGWRALGRLRPLLGLAILALAMLPWLVPYVLRSRGTFASAVLVGHYAAWYFQPGVTTRLAQVPNVLLNFLPWAVFLAGAVVWWRRAPDDGRRWVAWWTLTLWVLLGLSGTHRTRYLLPVYPGLALLAAEFLATGLERGGRRVLSAASFAFALFGLAAAAALASPLVSLVGGEDRAFVPDTPWERALLMMLLVVSAGIAALAARRGAFVAGAAGAALAIGAVYVVVGVAYPPRYARQFDVRGLAATAVRHAPPGAVILAHPDLRLSYDFYLRRRVVEVASTESLARALAASSRDVLIMPRARWDALAPRAGAPWRVLAAEAVAGREIVVVGSDAR